MDDVSWIILGLLVVVGLPAMAISAFVMVIRLKRRVAVLEGQFISPLLTLHRRGTSERLVYRRLD